MLNENISAKKNSLPKSLVFVSGAIMLGLAVSLGVIGWKYHHLKLKQSESSKSKFEKKGSVPTPQNSQHYNKRGNCQFCQATSLLGLNEKDLPDLTQPARVGVVNSLLVKGRNLYEKGVEFHKCQWLEKSTQEKTTQWNEYSGGKDETIVILKKTDQPALKRASEVDQKLVVKLVENEVHEVNDYRREVIKTGCKTLFELNPNLKWEWEVYVLVDNESTGNSNGVPLLLAFYSAYFQKPVPNNICATGAVDKAGKIGAIGGLREKIIAAVETGNKSLILPADKNYDSIQNKVLIPADPKWISEVSFQQFNQKYARKLKYYPVKDWKDLINLLENGF